MTVPIGPATEHLELGGADYWFCCPGCRNGICRRESRRMTAQRITGVVLAAGSSRRLRDA